MFEQTREFRAIRPNNYATRSNSPSIQRLIATELLTVKTDEDAVIFARKVLQARNKIAKARKHEETISRLQELILSDVETGTVFTFSDMKTYARNNRIYGDRRNDFPTQALRVALSRLVEEGAIKKVRVAGSHKWYNSYYNAYEMN